MIIHTRHGPLILAWLADQTLFMLTTKPAPLLLEVLWQVERDWGNGGVYFTGIQKDGLLFLISSRLQYNEDLRRRMYSINGIDHMTLCYIPLSGSTQPSITTKFPTSEESPGMLFKCCRGQCALHFIFTADESRYRYFCSSKTGFLGITWSTHIKGVGFSPLVCVLRH